MNRDRPGRLPSRDQPVANDDAGSERIVVAHRQHEGVAGRGRAVDTVTVIVAVPDWLAAGVSVIVRLAPLPPSTRLALGISV